MRAAFHDRYGTADVIGVRDLPRPEIGDDEVLVEVHAASVTTADWRLRASAFPAVFWLPGRLMFGLRRPKRKIPGSDFSGRVAAAGRNVGGLAVGDEVFGAAWGGANAEYVAVRADGPVLRKPAGIDHAGAAAVPFGALAALVFLRDVARIERGQRVLVVGASGGVGVFAVQLAKHFGAEVTGVCGTANMELVRALGADRVVDRTREDFTRNGEVHDVILDTVGGTTFARCRRALAPRGVYVPLEFGLREMAEAVVTRLTGGRRVRIGISADRRDDLAFVADLIGRGAVRPVIDSRFPLERIADAHRRVESRRKSGSVVLAVRPPEARRSTAA